MSIRLSCGESCSSVSFQCGCHPMKIRSKHVCFFQYRAHKQLLGVEIGSLIRIISLQQQENVAWSWEQLLITFFRCFSVNVRDSCETMYRAPRISPSKGSLKESVVGIKQIWKVHCKETATLSNKTPSSLPQMSRNNHLPSPDSWQSFHHTNADEQLSWVKIAR